MKPIRCYFIALFLVMLYPLLRMAEWLHEILVRDLDTDDK